MAEAQHGTGGSAVIAVSRERRRLDRAAMSRPFDETRNDRITMSSQLYFEYNRNDVMAAVHIPAARALVAAFALMRTILALLLRHCRCDAPFAPTLGCCREQVWKQSAA